MLKLAQFFDMKRIGNAEMGESGAGRTARCAVRASYILYPASQIPPLAIICCSITTVGRTRMSALNWVEWICAKLTPNQSR
jgi:hypothetical protein